MAIALFVYSVIMTILFTIQLYENHDKVARIDGTIGCLAKAYNISYQDVNRTKRQLRTGSNA
jgi:hypothetical protein